MILSKRSFHIPEPGGPTNITGNLQRGNDLSFTTPTPSSIRGARRREGVNGRLNPGQIGVQKSKNLIGRDSGFRAVACLADCIPFGSPFVGKVRHGHVFIASCFVAATGAEIRHA
ncbi:hypothetical protein GOX2709 (plasmid) [Gluconobacter oxydans 621H]|uniref:Uncharacterized protein n=1 Tax=Gluconobacter oxydans (strain 621H) TaxID=290633 RepID=Q5HXI0_GLUOX|nr:hypothetical protein GOX2709 [Gluconobacter oxydans 621H]